MESYPSPESLRAAMQSVLTADRWQYAAGERSRCPDIPDHELLRCIGRGAYGEVWLARNVFGSWRAVKLVWRDSFSDDDPYEREFRGIQRYEPVSRSNDGLMDILQAGRQDEHGCFYYVMELADDTRTADATAAGGARLDDPDGYVPATLASRRRACRRLPVSECLQLGLNLTSALGHLHRHGLIHRDIKPSNIIFVLGVAKLADIGLVAEIDQALSFVGTEGYIPPEGPTSPQADLYSLGKVLYEVSMGKDRKEYPDPMTGLQNSLAREEQEALMELNAVILKACAEDVAERYHSAEEMHADLALLQSGKSVKWRRLVEKRLAVARRIGLAVAVIALVTTFAWLYQRHQTGEARRLRQYAEDQAAEALRQEGIATTSVARLRIQKAEGQLQRGDSPQALAWLAHVLRRHPDHRVAAERIRAALMQRRFLRPLLAPLTHPATVDHARFSPDGTTIVTAAKDGRIRFWNTITGTERFPAYAHSGAVLQLTISPDGTKVLTASEDSTSCLLDIRKGTLVFPPLVHQSPVQTAEFSPDGEWIATGTAKAMLSRFSARTGQPIGHPRELAGAVNALQFSPDSRVIAIAVENALVGLRTAGDDKLVRRYSLNGPGRRLTLSPDGKWLAVAVKNETRERTTETDWEVIVWDVASGEMVAGPLIHDNVTSLSFSPDSTRLVTTDVASTAIVWRIPAGVEMFRIRHASSVSSAFFSPDGAHLLTASKDHTVRLWNGVTGQPAGEPVVLGGEVQYAEFNADGSRILTIAGENREVRVWSVPAERQEAKMLLHDRWVVAAVFDASGGSALTATSSVYPMANGRGAYNFDDPQSVIVWNARTATHRSAPEFPVPAEAVAVRFTATGPIAAIADRRSMPETPEFLHETRLWDMEKGAQIGGKITLSDNITCADISADGAKAAISSEDGAIVIVSATTGALLMPALTGNGRLNSIRFSPNGRLLVTAADDGTTRLIDAATGTPCAGPLAHAAPVWFAQFSPAGDRIVTLPLDSTARVWSLTGQPIAEFRHEAKVEYAEFSPDGTKLVTASGDRTARVWDATTGRQLTEEPLEHSHSVLTARFSPDGLRVVTASLDGTARVWDAATGLALGDPLRHNAGVISAAFSGDGRHAITASLDNSAAIWRVEVTGERIPSWLPELAEAVGGLHLNDDRVPQPVRWDTYEAVRTRLRNSQETEPLAGLLRQCFGP